MVNYSSHFNRVSIKITIIQLIYIIHLYLIRIKNHSKNEQKLLLIMKLAHSYFLKIAFLIFVLLNSLNVFSQKSIPATKAELIKFAEKRYGSDDRLINGVIGQTIRSHVEGHPFFLKSEWMRSDLYIHGEEFKNALIKYNIELDEFLFIDNSNYGTPTITLNSLFIDSVRIENHLIINAEKQFNQYSLGFAELIYKGGFMAILKHKTNHSIKYTDSYEYIEYNKPTSTLYISFNGNLREFKKKNDLLKHFYSYRKDISKFMHQNKINFKRSDAQQLILLLKYCDEVSSN